jgi:hypothetical protein
MQALMRKAAAAYRAAFRMAAEWYTYLHTQGPGNGN